MKKIMFVSLAFILLIAGIGQAAFFPSPVTRDHQITDTMVFSDIQVNSSGNDYVSVHMDTLDATLLQPGNPVIPKQLIHYELPFGVTDVAVEIIPGSIQHIPIDKQVRPAPQILSYDGKNHLNKHGIKNQALYESNDLYPESLYMFDVVCGLNDAHEHVTFVNIQIYPIRYQPVSNILHVLKDATLTLSYEDPRSEFLFQGDDYDLVVIAPSVFQGELEPLITHKNAMGLSTYLKTTEEIYNEYSGVDKPEKIKYFIKDAIESEGISYVLLVGGMDSMISGVSRDDTNQGSKDWYVPVRYTNLDVGSYDDPGFISDLYYADVYKEGGAFEDWDSDGNGIFSEWTNTRKDDLDLTPDVFVGRLACRNNKEVSTMVQKIINYEQSPVDDSWFKKIIGIAGDAFQDQQDLDFEWDTTSLPNGEYTIYAQNTNDEPTEGPVDIVTVTINSNQESNITFVEDDHLKTDSYPYLPIAEITSPSDGNILGSTNVVFTPPEAYDGYYWARVQYVNGIMHIRGKSYDPQPYGDTTDIKLWITNSQDEIVFMDWRNNTKTYYEDEWCTGERILNGRGGSMYYMPEDFDHELLWTSNGNWNGQDDVIASLSQGAGFVHFSGHASPRSWGDQYPGIPGGRSHASITGLFCFNPFGMPIFPMSKITNAEKLPIVVACGCHNGQFNVTILSTLLNKPFMWTYGIPLPECWSWWLTRVENGGSIATISNTGMGYGMPGFEAISAGLNPWLDTEFFRLYGQENKHYLGEAYEFAIRNYVSQFDLEDDDDGIGHVKSLQQWTLLGDPSLKMGGYE